MSTVSTIPTTHGGGDAHGDAHGHGDGHNPHLAHHFDTPEQQIASGKLGMWVFLATEILMFGGLFCAYSVYRHNHPDVFEFAHQYLDKTLGAINTVVLITSSLTMAWGVRLAQLGKQKGLIVCLALTIIGGYAFMGIKSVEYKTKWKHHLNFGPSNIYYQRLNAEKSGEGAPAAAAANAEHKAEAANGGKATPVEGHTPEGVTAARTGETSNHADKAAGVPSGLLNPEYVDPNAGTGDAANIRPVAMPPMGLAPAVVEEHGKVHAAATEEEHERVLESEYEKLDSLDKTRTATFFQIYFLMTGLHGIHVLVGMALIFWLLVKAVPRHARRGVLWAGLLSVGLFFVYVGALVGNSHTVWLGVVIGVLAIASLARALVGPPAAAAAAVAGADTGDFGPDYFAPVDIVGLYWHLVDLIWIFLFPLLYLIH